MKTLVVDNYDSFTYNLVHLLAIVNGEEPIVVRNDEVGPDEIAALSFDNIVISPGPGHPARPTDFGICQTLIERSEKPLLGVCLGHQGIVSLNGGTVGRAPQPVHGKAHILRHDGSELFRGMPPEFSVARYHSLAAQAPLPGALQATAWLTDASSLIMALAHRERPQWGVQFHPESIITELGEALLRNFRELSRPHVTRAVHIGQITAEPPAAVPATRSPGSDAQTLRAVVREAPAAVDAERAFLGLFAAESAAFWLDSSTVEHGRSRWSFMGAADGTPESVLAYDMLGRRIRLLGDGGSAVLPGSILDHLAAQPLATLAQPAPGPFQGGYVGWFGYELAGEVAWGSGRSARTPDALLIRADKFLAFDHVEGRCYAVAVTTEAEAREAQLWVDRQVERLGRLDEVTPSSPRPRGDLVHFTFDRVRDTYLSDVAQSLQWIGEGETYQVCLTNEITTACALDPLELYRVLRRINPAPYAAFLKWPGGSVLSASPERFLKVDASGLVETKPIKGTMRRSADAEQDAAIAATLAASAKDRAENVMIVDLLRNDLSRVCRPGSVQVPKLCAIESYATVHQLVSTVVGTLKPEANLIDLLRATFPGGSMTGAPKIRTLQFIDSLERRARGVYSGALGWLGHDGAADLSIVIRTIVQTPGLLSLGVGGGIVADSTPENEFEEMLLKAQASLRAIALTATGADDAFVLHGLTSAGEHGAEAREAAQ